MTPEQLVEEIKQSAWSRVEVKTNTTNGEPVFHVRDLEGRSSTTIRNYGEWLLHPLNKRNRPSRRERGELEEGLIA